MRRLSQMGGWLSVALALHSYSALTLAQAPADQIARLGKDLTCVGAQKEGNAEGTIPAYSGQWLGAPPGIKFEGTGKHPIDPYPNEKPLFVITAQNLDQYGAHLSEEFVVG